MRNKLFKPIFILIFIVLAFHYKFVLFGKIPFPGDLLVNSYSPWFDYHHFPSLNPIISDIFSQFFLWKYLAVDIIKSGSLPLWNPYSFSGTPLLATYHSATLYPLNLLLFFLKPYSWGLYILSSSLLSAVFMYLFLSLYIKQSSAKIIGSLIFTFSSLMTTWLEFGTAVHGMAWLPLSLYLINKFTSTEKYRYLLLLPLSLASTILAGNLQATTYVFIISSIYTILLTQSLKKIVPIIFFIVLGIFICSIQIFPSYELLKNSIRTGDSYIKEGGYGLLTLDKTLTFFSADYFGHPSTRNYWGFLNYSETSNYLGAITLPLLIFSILYLKRSRLKVFSLGLLILSLMLLFKNPLTLLLYQTQIPLLTQSYASRILFITIFSASILSALSVNQIIEERYKNFLKTLIFSVAIISGILAGTYLAKNQVNQIIQNSPDKIHTTTYLSDNYYNNLNFEIALKNTLIPFGILITALVITLFSRFEKLRFALPLILIIIISTDLGRYFLKFNPFVDQNLAYPTTPTIEFLQKQPGHFRVAREHAEVFPPNTWIAYGLESPEGYDALYLNDYGRFMHLINGGNFNTGSTGRYAEIANYNSPDLRFTNTKYFIAILRDKNGQIPGDLVNFQFKEAGYRPVFQDKSSVILENPNYLERVYFKDSNNKAEIISYKPNTIKITTNSSSNDQLTLLDQYDSGWKVQIDNKDSGVIKADYVFRGVNVPSGNHSVQFYYWPTSIDLGIKITLISLFLLAITAFFSYHKKRI